MVRYRGQTRVSARTSNTRRVTRPHEARDPYRRNQREHVRRSRGRRADVDHRRSERRARSEDTHTHPGWSRTSEPPWGSRDPTSRRESGAWDHRQSSRNRERTPKRRTRGASEGQQNKASVNLTKTFVEAVSQSQTSRASGKKSTKEKEERNIRK